MRTLLTILLTIAILFLGAIASPNGEYIEEDDPRWNCQTMGNKECGPQIST